LGVLLALAPLEGVAVCFGDSSMTDFEIRRVEYKNFVPLFDWISMGGRQLE
jgi:hypothetical protein